MSSLDGVDLFHPSRFETSHDVVTFQSLSEDSIQQYSHVKLQRRSQARQRIEQKNTGAENVNKAEQVQVTISEDTADGRTAKLDAFLKFLGDDKISLLIPSDELDDDEIHIIETIDEARVPGNIALQDYQMQLLLLEQQNKKRLLMASQKHNLKSRKFPVTAKAVKYRKLFEKRLANQERVERFVPSACSQRLEEGRPISKMPPKRQRAGNGAPAREEKRGKANDTHSLLLDEDNVTDGDNLTVDQGAADEARSMPPLFDIIYVIRCTQGHHSSHPVAAFRDTPIPDALFDPDEQDSLEGLSHLNGAIPIFDLNAFMENDTDGIAFVIIRTVECSQSSVVMARAGVRLRWTEDIYTKSTISKNVLQNIATCYFQPLGKSDQNDVFHSEDPPPPFEQYRITPVDLFLFHHRRSLQDHITEHPETKHHIDALLKYISHWFDSEFSEAESLFARGLVSSSHILKLYKPNDLIVSGTYGRPAAFVVQEWPAYDEGGWVTLVCWSFQTDGAGFARKQSILSIPPIESDTKVIQTLAAYPFRFASSQIQDSIRNHGRKQWDLRSASQITYKGSNVKKDQFFPDARFMIDHNVYHKMHEHASAFSFRRPKMTHPFDRMPAYLSTGEVPSETALLLLPPDIYGFYLNEKKWVHLFVDCIYPVRWNKKAYDRLVLPAQTKDLVRALVTVRTSQRGVKQGIGVAGKRTDITTGKGNGLIMLLHGGPGTGKTLTAESVAEIAEMPLYRVTCGDIGTSAEAVERYLSTVLHLGKIWNCVLLLDEADVFLEERSMADLKRNSLVSVFLRILEYYDGILILTSNRVGMFDEAFKSRIQVALHYENLCRSSRKMIWQNFVDMLEEDEEDVNFDEIKLHLDDLAGKELNGRQIRNVLTTARQLAIFRNERLDWEHLVQALSVSSDFSAYLKRVQGHTDDQRARDIGLR